MEQHGHIVLVVGRIEASDVDGTAAQAIAEVLGVKGGFAVVLEVDGLAVRTGVCDPSRSIISSAIRFCQYCR